MQEHAADAITLLDTLGIDRAHVAGHSSGAAVAAQVALDAPGRVGTLTLLELSLLSLPCGSDFLQGAAPVFEAYNNGDPERALAMFLTAVSAMDWGTCRTVLEDRIPGAIAQAIKDADTFFGVELPGVAAWTFGPEHAATISHPVLSVYGTETQPLWREVASFLRTHMPDVEDCPVDGVGHLLHIERPEPVAQGVAAFLDRHSMSR